MTVSLLLLIIACVLFIVSAAGVQSRVNLQSLGLAVATLALILQGIVVT